MVTTCSLRQHLLKYFARHLVRTTRRVLNGHNAPVTIWVCGTRITSPSLPALDESTATNTLARIALDQTDAIRCVGRLCQVDDVTSLGFRFSFHASPRREFLIWLFWFGSFRSSLTLDLWLSPLRVPHRAKHKTGSPPHVADCPHCDIMRLARSLVISVGWVSAVQVLVALARHDLEVES